MRYLLFIAGILLPTFSFAVEKKPEIVSIEGSLFYHGKKQWSENIFDRKFSIWNASIGEGSLKGPADRTLFTIEANGTKTQKVKIKIEQFFEGKKKTLVETSKSFAFRNDGETMSIPVLVEDLTAGEVTVTAHVEEAGKPVSSIKTAQVRYGGGR